MGLTPVLWTLAVVLVLGAALLACWIVGWQRLREQRRTKVSRALDEALAGRWDQGWPEETRRSVLLELSDRLDREALRTLVEVQPLLEAARADIRARSWTRRCRGWRVLGVTEVTAEELLSGLRDSHPEVRAAAASVSSAAQDALVPSALVEMLGDENPRARFMSLDTLVRLGRPALPALHEAVRALRPRTAAELSEEERAELEADAEIRRRQHTGLPVALPEEQESIPEAVGELHAETDLVHPGVRMVRLRSSAPAPARGAAADTLPRPLRALREVAPAERQTLLLLQGLAGAHTTAPSEHPDDVIARLCALAGDVQPRVREAATRVLAAAGTARQLREAAQLRGLAGDPDGRVRVAALDLIVHAWGLDSLPDLLAGLHDRDHGVRSRAAALLAELGEPGLVMLLQCCEGSDRYAADVAAGWCTTGLGLGDLPWSAPLARPADAGVSRA